MEGEPGADPRLPRRVVAGIGWVAPAVVLAAPAPAYAASPCALTAVVQTGGVGGAGFDLDLRHSKRIASLTNTSPSNTAILNLTLQVSDLAGNPVTGATVVMAGDETKDAEGNYMIGFSDPSDLGTIPESPIKRISTQTSVLGLVTTKVSTATYQAVDCPSVPRTGTWTVSLSLPGCAPVVVPFTYRVYASSGVC